jgi:transposase InsO family protein
MGKEMPWEEITMSGKRAEFVLLAGKEDRNMSALCKRFGISRKTGYKWLKRHTCVTAETLQDRSRHPLHSPQRSTAAQEEAVVSIRRAHPAWGGCKIAHVLARDWQLEIAPSTVTRILHRHGLIEPTASEAATPWQRFEHEHPNSLWQMDFKGHFAVGQARCHPLTILDDHSRYNVALAACKDEQHTRYRPAGARLRPIWPAAAHPYHNGPPWGTCGQESLSGLAVWLIRLGIRLSHSRLLHPQSNGKDERFHRSFKAEVLAHRCFENMAQAQDAFDRWRMVL